MLHYQAFIFDLNGTMIDDMPYHIQAWHRILNELGARLSLERVKEECYGKNHELLERIFPGRFTEAEKDRMSIEKERAYQQAYGPALKLMEGLHDFLGRAKKAGIKTAIGSAAILFNIDFVLDGARIRHLIDTVVSADDVQQSKPHPETFLKCAAQLNVMPENCLVFEDAPKGVESAALAGMDCIVLTTLHRPDEFVPAQKIIGFVDDYKASLIKKLL